MAERVTTAGWWWQSASNAMSTWNYQVRRTSSREPTIMAGGNDGTSISLTANALFPGRHCTLPRRATRCTLWRGVIADGLLCHSMTERMRNNMRTRCRGYSTYYRLGPLTFLCRMRRLVENLPAHDRSGAILRNAHTNDASTRRHPVIVNANVTLRIIRAACYVFFLSSLFTFPVLLVRRARRSDRTSTRFSHIGNVCTYVRAFCTARDLCVGGQCWIQLERRRWWARERDREWGRRGERVGDTERERKRERRHLRPRLSAAEAPGW